VIADDDMVTFFTLTSDDLAWLGSNVCVENRLGAAVQLCAPPWLGWIPDDLTGCPSAAVDCLANQLGLAGGDVPGLLSSYGGWEGRTRRDHRALVLGWAGLGWAGLGWAGEHRVQAIASSSTRSCSLGRWNTTRPVCCFSWRATAAQRADRSSLGGRAVPACRGRSRRCEG